MTKKGDRVGTGRMVMRSGWTRSIIQQHFFDVISGSEMLHSARMDTNTLEAAMRSFRPLLLTISYEIAAFHSQ